MDNLLFQTLEEQGRRAPRDILPRDPAEDGLLEFFAAEVCLGTGFQKSREAPFFRKSFNLTSADAQSASIDAPGNQKLGEVFLRGAREVAVPLAQRLE